MKNIIGHLKSIFRLPRKQTGKPPSFREVFRRFREVLDTNNRALEIITDMGDKLSGDYLFDINYINLTYSELSAAVLSSIQSFDSLTQNKYPRIHDVFSRIDNRINGLIYDIVSASDELVVFYEDIAWDMSRDVGGKNAHLAELKNYLKLNIPDAFAITTRAFDEFIKHNRLNEKIESLNANSPPINPSLSKGGQRGGMLDMLQDLIINANFPPAMDSAIEKAIKKMKTRCGEGCFLAVRSSAEEEDGEFSFAGQFETVLNVSLEREAVKEAYKKVVASLFSEKAVAYLNRLGYDSRKFKMAVGCMAMVDAASSGVIYSTNPDGDRNTLIINAAWGLGKSVVEGQTDADLYFIKKGLGPEIIGITTGRKEFMTINLKKGGTEKVNTPDKMIARPCLATEQAIELTRQSVSIEKHFRKPQDIEWAIDRDGKIFILQARPLKIQETQSVIARGEATKQSLQSTGTASPEPALSEKTRLLRFVRNDSVLIKNKGIVVQRGVSAGRVFILKHMDELDNFPKGSILVSRYDSSNFVRVMPYVSAIITDVGTPTSHMASLCREFKVPTIVNAGNATEVLKHGQEITVNADDNSITIYDGIIMEPMEFAAVNSMKMEDVYEFRKKKYVLRYISPLNLIDPLLEEFTVERCKTMHDILRFIHEKSVTELVDSARYGTGMLKKHAAVKLDLPIPAGIIVIDIGGGMNLKENSEKATFKQMTSIPLKAIIQGMLHPGVWHSDMISLKAKDFLSSMMRMSDITMENTDYVGYNVAVVSREYVNLSLRFGYHFNMLDCYCSENARNNHIYFRFVGGATDIVKRSRRVELIAAVLKEYGFNLKIKGDLIIARLANIRQEAMENILEQLGRLIAYTRQLDAMLHDDNAVERYVKNFIEGRYEL